MGQCFPIPGESLGDIFTDDDDIVMPAGPPPGADESDSDDDIPMPEGPPPGTEGMPPCTWLLVLGCSLAD